MPLKTGHTEGLATAVVVSFVARARPEALPAASAAGTSQSLRPVLIGLAVAALSASVAAQAESTSILIVDDDWDYQYTHPGSLGGRPYYTSALDALGLGYEVWDVQTQGQPTSAASA